MRQPSMFLRSLGLIICLGIVPGMAHAAIAPGAPGRPLARPMPSRAVDGNDQVINGGPRFITGGASDADDAIWLGSEDQGIWRYYHGVWSHYGASDGVADDNVYAVACDAWGRIWAGTGSHGVSVYNGAAWQNYDVTRGPIGSRIFAFATNPLDSSLWMATSAGLCRYSLTDDTWSYFDRGTGMPDNLASSLAFDRLGNLYVGLAADGIAIASNADHYSSWRHITGPDQMPIIGAGDGLPGPLVNAVQVDLDGTIYAGTTRGLARSFDHGVTWSYLRGKNWPDLAKGRYEGVPDGFAPDPAATPLLQDWITSLALDESGTLWIGYREAGFQTFSTTTDTIDYTGKGKTTCIVAPPGSACMIGTYGQGATVAGVRYTRNPNNATPHLSTDARQIFYPAPAALMTAQRLTDLAARVAAWPAAEKTIHTLPDDWQTKGDWVGRYGKQYVILCGYAAMLNGQRSGNQDLYNVGVCCGPYRAKAALRSYEDAAAIKKLKVADNALFNPWEAKRVTGEYNDNGYDLANFPRTLEGPDLYVQVRLPEGVHQVSIYFHNFDGHVSNNIYRDYLLLAKSSPGKGLDQGNQSGRAQFLNEDLSVDAELAPALARSRVPTYWNGVYKRFIVHGAGTYWIKIDRNHSMAAKMQGVFIDRLDQPHANVLALPTGMDLPTPPEGDTNGPVSTTFAAAARLWSALDAAADQEADGAMVLRCRLEAYRAAAAEKSDSGNTLLQWRRQIAIWTDGDRAEFDAYVAAKSK